MKRCDDHTSRVAAIGGERGKAEQSAKAPPSSGRFLVVASARVMDEPRDRRAIRKLLDDAEWDRIYPRLVAFATSRVQSLALGKDLAHEAVARVYSHDSTWDPAKHPDLERYLMSLVNSKLANDRSSAAAQRNVSIDQVRASAERVKDSEAPADEQLANAQIFARRMEMLRERLAGDEDALRALDLKMNGIETPAAIASAARWLLKRAAAACLRVQRNAASVARDIGGDETEDASSDEDDDEEEEVA